MTDKTLNRLTPSQLNALAVLANFPLTEMDAMVRLGPQRRRILQTLEDVGLVQFRPYARPYRGAREVGTWGLTPAGRARVKALVKAGDLEVLDTSDKDTHVITTEGT